MFAVAITSPNALEVVEIPAPTPGPYEARIKTEVACLCNSTDRKLIEGHFPGYDRFPMLLGHETVGIVDAVGAKVRTFAVGDRVVGGLLLKSTDPGYVSGWGGFSEYIIAGDHDAMVADGVAMAAHGWVEVHEIMRPVTQEIAVEDAVMLCTWREVYSAFDDFNLRAGDDIVVFGAGPVGLSFVKFGRLLSLGEIHVVEPLAPKRDKALALGATAAYGLDALAQLREAHPQPFDAVIDAVGKESIINEGVTLVRMGGSVCVYGVIDQSSVQVHHGRGPYNFNLYIHQWPTRFRERAAQDPLVAWIKAGKITYREFITNEYDIHDISAGFEHSKTGAPIKTLFRF